MTESPHKKDCPSCEELSAYLDKECSSPEEIEKHLKICSSCRAYADSLAKIGQSIKGKVSVDCGSDEEISRRILAKVHESVKETDVPVKRRFFLSPVQWRAAVLLMVGGAIGYLLWKEMQTDKMSVQKNVLTVQKSAGVNASFSSGPVKNQETIHFSSTDRSVASREIKQNISHTWTIPANSTQGLSSLLKKNNIPETALTKTEKGLCLQCSITKSQVAHFVKDCSDAGFQLSSSDQPQPNQKYYTGHAEDIVLYSAVFVSKK